MEYVIWVFIVFIYFLTFIGTCKAIYFDYFYVSIRVNIEKLACVSFTFVPGCEICQHRYAHLWFICPDLKKI